MKKIVIYVCLLLVAEFSFAQADSLKTNDIEKLLKSIESVVTDNNKMLKKVENDSIKSLNAQIKKLQKDVDNLAKDTAKNSKDLLAYRKLCADTAKVNSEKRKLEKDFFAQKNALETRNNEYDKLVKDKAAVEQENADKTQLLSSIGEMLLSFYAKPFDDLCDNVTLQSLESDDKLLKELGIEIPARLQNLKTFKEAEMLLAKPYSKQKIDSYVLKLKNISEESVRKAKLITYLKDYDYVQHSFAVELFEYVKRDCEENKPCDSTLKKERRFASASRTVHERLASFLANDEVDVRANYPYIYGKIQTLLNMVYTNPDQDMNGIINELKK